MRFVISTYFNDKNYNIPSQRLEIKTNELQRAFEVCRAFVIGSKSCKMDIWENRNKTKLPEFKGGVTMKKQILKYTIRVNKKYNEIEIFIRD